jgi:hypothetical protein
MTIYGLISNYILFPLFIPDDCYFHLHETPYLVEILFDFPAYSGFHPVPSKMGYLISGIVGLLIGRFINFRLPNVIAIESIDEISKN